MGGDRGRIIRDFRKMLHFGKIPKKFGQIWRKFSKILAKIAKFWKKTAKNSAIFNENFEIREPNRPVWATARVAAPAGAPWSSRSA